RLHRRGKAGLPMNGNLSLAPSGVRQEGAAITIAGLEKWYGSVQVLKGITLDVQWGEKIVLCGPSGSGKSTLIRCINQLERHQSGHMTVDGMLKSGGADLIALRREVGMVF